MTVLTPEADDRWFGPAAFAVDAVPSRELAKWLRTRRAVLVQDKAGRHSPFANAVRVSPAAHATMGEVDRLVEAVREVVRAGQLPAS